MFDHAVLQRAACSKAEKLGCMEVIRRILGLQAKMEERGVIAFEEELKTESNTMLGVGLSLVLNGASSEIVRLVMCNFVHSSDYSGGKLLEQILIAEGIVFIHSYSEYSRLLPDILTSYLGEDMIGVSKEELSEFRKWIL